VTVPKISVIRDQIISDIETTIGQTIPISQKAFFRVLATAIAGALNLIYRFGLSIFNQIFPQTAEGSYLTLLAAKRGITRIASQAAELTADATGTPASVIIDGTLWQYSGVAYKQDGDTTLDAYGVGEVYLIAQETGEKTNIQTGLKINLITPILGIDSEATITGIVITGNDAESDDNLRIRLMQDYANQPQGGAIPDFVGWALDIPGIVKAWAWNNGAGTGLIYPLVAITGDDRIPDAAKLTEVETYVNDPVRRPLGTTAITAEAMTERLFTIDVTTINPDTTTNRNLLETAFTEFLQSRYPRQYADESNPVDYVTKSALSAVATGAGITIFDCDLYIDGTATPILSHILLASEISNLGAVTWPS